MASALRGYDDEYLACRFGRHAMTVDGFYRENGTIVTLMHCDRCTVSAYDTTNARTGRQVKGRRYTYPDDYTIPGGTELRLVRLERFARAARRGEIGAKP